MKKSRGLVLFVFFVMTLSSGLNSTFFIKVEPPQIVSVVAHLSYGDLDVANGSSVYYCSTFNITVNVSDDKELEYLNVTYLDYESFRDLSGSTEASEPFIILNPGRSFQVVITVQDQEGYTIYFVFYVVCCNNPLTANVSINGMEVEPLETVYACGNVTINVSVSSDNGLDFVAVSVVPPSGSPSSEYFELSDDTIDTEFHHIFGYYVGGSGVYEVTVLAYDLCQHEIRYTYYIVCNRTNDYPPRILKIYLINETEQYSVENGASWGFCGGNIGVVATDDVGIVRVVIYMDGTPIHDVMLPEADTNIYWTGSLDVESGTHTIRIVVYDTSGNTDEWTIYITCSSSLPIIDVDVNLTGVEIANESSVSINANDLGIVGFLFTVDCSASPIRSYFINVGTAPPETYSHEYASISGAPTEISLSVAVNLDDVPIIDISGGTRSPYITMTRVLAFRIELTDFYGHRALFVFSISITQTESLIRDASSSAYMSLSAIGLGILLGIVGSIITLGTITIAKKVGLLEKIKK